MQDLERRQLDVGYIPILCAAPLLVAHARGSFVRRGLEVRLHRAAGWSGIKELMAYGKLDAAHMLSPMPLACNLGIDGKPCELRLAAIQNINGQAITLARQHLGVERVEQLRGFTFGVPYRFSMHYYLLCHFLAEHGVDPLADVSIIEVAPPNVPYYLREGLIDGALAPEPYNQIPVNEGLGFIFRLSKEIWDGHPCCSFATSRGFVDEHPRTHRALLSGLLEAEMLLHSADVNERRQIAREISGPDHLDLDDSLAAEQVLSGQFPDGRGATRTVRDRIDFVPHPFVADGAWMLTQMQRWGQLGDEVDYQQVVANTFDIELAQQLATKVGYSATRNSTAATGMRFGVEDPAAYLHSLPTSRAIETTESLPRRELPADVDERLGQLNGRLAEVVGGRLDVGFEVTGDDELGRLEQLLGELVTNSRFARQLLEDRNSKLRSRGAQLQQEREGLATTLSSIQDGVISVDRERRVRRLNPAAERLTGWSASAAQGRPVDEVLRLFDEETGRSAPDLTTRVLARADNANHGHAVLLRSRRGDERVVLANAAPLVGPRGELLGALITLYDQSRERERAQLLHDRDTIAAILDGIDDPIYVADWETYALLRVNRAFEEIWGDEGIGKPCYEVIRDRSEVCPFCPKSRLAPPSDGYLWESQHERTGKWYRHRDRLVRWHDGRLAHLQTMVDIDDFKRAESALRERVKELACLDRVSTLLRADKIDGEIFRAIVAALPEGWQYPEIARARLTFDGEVFESASMTSEHGRLEATIEVDGDRRGTVVVCYAEQRPTIDEGPFLREERALVDRLAAMIADAVTHSEVSRRFRDLYEQAPDMLCSVDAETGLVTQCNQTLIEMTGFARDEIVGQPIFERYSSESLPDAERAFETFVRTGEINDAELKLRRKAGPPLDVSLNVRAVLDADGRVIYSRSSWRDISDRKALEQKLERGRLRAKGFLDNVSDPVIVSDDESRLLYANEAMQRLLGRDPSQTLGHSLLDFVHRDDQEATRAAYAGLRGGDQERATFENRLLDAEGAPRDLLWTLSTRWEQDEAREIWAIARDITARKREERRLFQILEGVPAGVFILGAETQKPYYANKMAKRLLGRGVDPSLPAAALAETYKAFVAGGDQLYPTERMPIVRALQGEATSVDDMVIEQPNGRVPLHVSAQPIYDENGALLFASAAFVDVSERQHTEDQLRDAMEALERSNAELEQFAYVASHDLQEPLRMVASYSQLLAQRYHDKLDDKGRMFIEYAVDGAKRMQRLINDLLTFSRVGTRPCLFEPVRCEEVVAQVLATLKLRIEESEARVEVSWLPTVLGDAGQLAQLFQNLLQNAIKFRGERPPRIQVTARQEGEIWELCVADNGIGIEPQYHERIFAIFQRLHERDRYAGSGIGLSIVKKIVERHGGTVRIESGPGEGTRFLFTLRPAEQASEGPQRPTSQHEPA
jgi:nitrate/nitrite transport system substrate-binding protein